ncbi:MAG: DUF423 domain-containing protein [Deltaproteobacteria bacterium]|nr:DUF423 domain-containing protein [Deltaproteobacteria bacterium]
MAKVWIVFGALSGFLSVAFGAFGAHGLSTRLDARMLEVFRTGAQYQMYHALALIGLGLWAVQNPGASSTVPGWCFAAGSLIFSGSLYALAISGVKWLGVITPIGGLLFMIGWLAFAVSAYNAAIAGHS